MMSDAADLSRLNDIVTPPPVPWWPPAPAWWILGAGVLAALAILAWAALLRYRRNAYRRAALAELDKVGRLSDAKCAAAVSAILKRVALVAYPRANVASLTGKAWLSFLDRTGETSDFTRGAASALADAAFGAPIRDGDAVLAAARHWVTHHRVKAAA